MPPKRLLPDIVDDHVDRNIPSTVQREMIALRGALFMDGKRRKTMSAEEATDGAVCAFAYARCSGADLGRACNEICFLLALFANKKDLVYSITITSSRPGPTPIHPMGTPR